MPKISPRTEIRKILGVFNVCKGFCLDLAEWVKSLQTMLKAKQLPKIPEIKDRKKEIMGENRKF